MSSGLSSSPTNWDLERVLSTIRAYRGLRERMGTRPPRNARQRARLEGKKSGQGPPSPFDALSMRNDCTRRLVSAHPPIPSTLRCHIARHRVAQHPARSSTTPSVPVAASSMDDTSPRRPVHASLRAEPKFRRLHPSLHHVISIFSACRVSTHAPRLQQPLSPHPTTLLPQHFQRAPGHSPLVPASYNTSSKRSTRAQNTRTLRTTSWSRPRRPPRPHTSTAAFSSTPRARPSRSCDPSLRHAQGPPHFYEHPVLRIASPHPRM
ncbi:hypothetical protein B0H13DRAFT_2051470 [Mycena leptocephala]|nr:hypothetical protein B0H13DRAFT_2051470 [Mycena leptocephala]